MTFRRRRFDAKCVRVGDNNVFLTPQPLPVSIPLTPDPYRVPPPHPHTVRIKTPASKCPARGHLGAKYVRIQNEFFINFF